MACGFVLAIPVFFDTVFFLLVPLARARYRLDWPGGTVEGTTDENGFTQRIGTEYRVEQITVTYYPPDQELAEDNHHPGGCD